MVDLNLDWGHFTFARYCHADMIVSHCAYTADLIIERILGNIQLRILNIDHTIVFIEGQIKIEKGSVAQFDNFWARKLHHLQNSSRNENQFMIQKSSKL